MSDDQQLKNILARRTVLRGAAMLGGGAALSTAFPSLVLNAADTPAAAPKQTPNVSGAPASQQPMVSKVRFSEEFLSNKIFKDTPLKFDSPSPVRIGDKLVETGALVQPSGDVLFRIYAPKAREIVLRFGLVRDGELTLTKQQDGLFEGILPYDENHTGPMSVGVMIDGTTVLDHYIPIFGSYRPHNVVEIPDSDLEFMFIKAVPHGAFGREIYRSDVLKSSERCTVYTPPGYMKSNKEYPVLYLQHGGNENETVWQYTGKVGYILDNLIAAGKAEPFIVVMNNDMLRYSETSGIFPVDDAFERLLIEDCIPYIEKNYRVKTGKWNRALGGLSMGSMMSCDIAFRHPELFGNLGTLTASMTHESFPTTYERPYPTVTKDAKKFAENYKIYFRSTTPREDHYSDYFIADDKLCATSGIDKLPGYHRVVYPARTTKWNSWRLGLRDFAQLLFR